MHGSSQRRKMLTRRMVGFLMLTAYLHVETAPAGDTDLRPEPRLLVLEDADSDYSTPPFDDTVRLVNSSDQVVRTSSNYNICETIGGCRAVSADERGEFFVVCENVAERITQCEIATGNPVWSLEGEFTAAAISKGLTYALTGSGTIYGDSLMVIDPSGTILNKIKAGGFDLVVDRNRDVIWLVGRDIRKYDIDLKPLLTLSPITWCAVSADLAQDGSLWVVESEHPDVAGSRDRLLNVSPRGAITMTIPLDITPKCVRVDRTSNRIYVTGHRISTRMRPTIKFDGYIPRIKKRRKFKHEGSRTHCYSAKGGLLYDVSRGGNSIAVDTSDGSVWIAGESKLFHYSRSGKKLDACNQVSDGQKWIATVPDSKEPE